MKHNEYSLRLRDAHQKQPSESTFETIHPLQLRLEAAFRIVESLGYAESALEYQILMRELRSLLQPPG